MASETSGYGGILAMFAFMIIVMIAAFIAWQVGVFGAGERRSIDGQASAGEVRS